MKSTEQKRGPASIKSKLPRDGAAALDLALPGQPKELQSTEKPDDSELAGVMADFHRAAADSVTVGEWIKKLDGNPNNLQRMLAKVFAVKGSSAALELFNQTSNCVPGSWRHTFRVVVEMAGSLQPKNASQGILVSQLIGVHAQAMEAMRRCRTATDPELQELYSNRSIRLMRLFAQQTELLARLQGTIASQKIVVEKVHVHSGGQAIVGAVETVDRGGGDGGST